MKVLANTKLLNAIIHLPKELSKDLEDYVDYLIKQDATTKGALSNENNSIAHLTPPRVSSGRGYGSLKGKIWLSDDFDEPLAEFEDYM
jgi:hypothetical protein